MAYLAQDDKEQQDTQGAQQGSSQLASGASGGTSIAGSGAGAGGNLSPAGPGGSGGFTNIQAYLNANQGQTGSADYLNKTVGGQFDQEKQAADSESNQAKQAADQATSSKIGQDEASRLISDAGSQFSFNSPSDTYKGDISQLQNYLGANYSGPTNYQHQYAPDTQRFGQDLSNDKGFNSLLDQTYRQAAGGQFGQGMLDLQHQLDQDNPALLQARSQLNDQYSKLQDYLNGLNQSTSNYLGQQQSGFQQGQTDLRNYLNQAQQTAAGKQDYGRYNAIADTLGLGNYMQPTQVVGREGDRLSQGTHTFNGVQDSATAPIPAPVYSPAPLTEPDRGDSNGNQVRYGSPYSRF